MWWIVMSGHWVKCITLIYTIIFKYIGFAEQNFSSDVCYCRTVGKQQKTTALIFYSLFLSQIIGNISLVVGKTLASRLLQEVGVNWSPTDHRSLTRGLCHMCFGRSNPKWESKGPSGQGLGLLGIFLEADCVSQDSIYQRAGREWNIQPPSFLPSRSFTPLFLAMFLSNSTSFLPLYLFIQGDFIPLQPPARCFPLGFLFFPQKKKVQQAERKRQDLKALSQPSRPPRTQSPSTLKALHRAFSNAVNFCAGKD